MRDITTIIDLYLAGYGEPDPAKSGELLARAFTDDASLIDPPLEAKGLDGIITMARTVQSLYPGHRFRRTTGVDEHHGFARYGWQLLGTDGAEVLTGMDIVELAGDGRLAQVVGFFGAPAALAGTTP